MTGNMLLILIILCEIWGLSAFGIKKFHKTLIFYTQLSNLAALLSACLLLTAGGQAWITAFRYLSVCMLIMTFIVTVFVLLPLSHDAQTLLWSRAGFFLHVAGPFLNLLSYRLYEAHAGPEMMIFPPLVTLLYGVIMLYLNYREIIDGPYPFLRVHKQSRLATALWIIVLLAAMTMISMLVCALCR